MLIHHDVPAGHSEKQDSDVKRSASSNCQSLLEHKYQETVNAALLTCCCWLSAHSSHNLNTVCIGCHALFALTRLLISTETLSWQNPISRLQPSSVCGWQHILTLACVMCLCIRGVCACALAVNVPAYLCECVYLCVFWIYLGLCMSECVTKRQISETDIENFLVFLSKCNRVIFWGCMFSKW